MNRALTIAFVIYMFIVTYGWIRGAGLDDTDPPRTSDWFPERSGMELFADHLTGCQYLRGGSLFGGSALTPRLDANGKQVCKRGDQ